MQKTFHHLTFAALIVFALGTFTSVSFSALGHILLLGPGIYFTIKNFKDVKLSRTTWALLGVVLSIILSVIFNLDILEKPLANIFKAKYFIIPVLGIFALNELGKGYLNDKKISWALNLFLLATTVASLSGIVAYYTGFNYLKMKPGCHPERACGLYGMYMTYGYGISLFQVILVGFLLYRKEVSKWLPTWRVVTAFVINGLGLYLAFARGGWIGFLLPLPLFFLKKKKRMMIALSMGVLLAFVLSYSFVTPFKNMLQNREGSNDQRISFAKTAIVAFKEKPIFGWGYRNFEPNVKALKKKYHIAYEYFGGHAHNNYLEHLASTGILGFLAFALFTFFWLLESYKRDDLIARITFPFVASFIVSGLFQYTFGDGENLFLIMTIFMIFEATSVGIFVKKSLPES